jgi:hypothetical protein
MASTFYFSGLPEHLHANRNQTMVTALAKCTSVFAQDALPAYLFSDLATLPWTLALVYPLSVFARAARRHHRWSQLLFDRAPKVAPTSTRRCKLCFIRDKTFENNP